MRRTWVDDPNLLAPKGEREPRAFGKGVLGRDDLHSFDAASLFVIEPRRSFLLHPLALLGQELLRVIRRVRRDPQFSIRLVAPGAVEVKVRVDGYDARRGER